MSDSRQSKAQSLPNSSASQPLAECESSACGCGGTLARREFLKLTGLAAAGALVPGLSVMAGPFESSEFEKLVPADKKLDPAWIKSLFERGTRTSYRALRTGSTC